MSDQKKECGCASNALLVELLQAMTAQNKVMAQIVDQNSELMAMMQSEPEDDEPKSQYLDG